MTCETVGCDDVAVFYDPMQNAVCPSCKSQDVMEGTYNEEDFEFIEG